MGLKDRFNAAKHYLWSPMSISMLQRGSDLVVRAGQTATVVIFLEDEPDPAAERVELILSMNYKKQSWPLAELAPTIGRHELEVQIPIDAGPSSRFTQYSFSGQVRRKKGTEPDAVSPVFVIGDPAHVYVPDGPVSEGSISLDRDRVNAGEAISGRAPGADKVEVGVFVDQLVGFEGGSKQEQTFQVLGEATPGADGAFSVVVPEGVQPTVWDGDKCWVTYEARAKDAWARFAVLDPEGKADIPVQKATISQYLG